MEIYHGFLTPRIVVDPESPRSSKSSCRLRHDGEPADEDEYMTAQSDVDEFEDANDGPGEPVMASSSESLGMSTLPFYHEQWLQPYKKENCSRTLVGPSVAAGADGLSISSGSNEKKLNSSIRGGTRRLLGGYLTMKKLRVASPGFRYPSPRGKSKWQSLMIGSPLIDRTSIRPVKELKFIFSPRLRAIADRESTAEAKNFVPKPIATIVPSTGSRLQTTPGTVLEDVNNN